MISFYLYPVSLELKNGASTTNPAPGPLSKSTPDDSTKVSWSPGGSSCDRGNDFYLTGTLGAKATFPAHGDITGVWLKARCWRSQVNGVWCLWSDDRAQDEDPFVIVGADWNGSGWSTWQKYEVNAETHGYYGPTYQAGRRVLESAAHGATPSSVQEYNWDLFNDSNVATTWDDDTLDQMEIRMESSSDFKGFNGVFHVEAGHPRYAPTANTPRWNCSQLVIYVEADDPPVPSASGGSFLGG